MADEPYPSSVIASDVASRPRGKPLPSSVKAWRASLLRHLLWFAGFTAVGTLFRQPLLGLCVALGAALALHLRDLRLLRYWVDSPKRRELPERNGVWGQIFEALEELQRSNRKRKKRLAAILAEFQASTAALPDGAVVLGEQGQIIWFNRSAQLLLGLQTAQDLGIRIANLIRHPDFADYMARGAYEGEVEVPSPLNIGITLALRVIPYGNGQRLLIVRDVSQVRGLEAARRNFVSNASHELRTPLTVLRGYLDVIEPETRPGGPLEEWQMPVAEMRSQAARMESLVSDMLKLAKLESSVYDGNHDPVEAGRIALRAVEDARAMSQGEHRFEVQVDEELGLIGRETEIHSIFANLLSNAVRYTPPGGRIAVSWASDDEGAAFAVSDDGIGIAEEDIPHLTERFYRVDVGRSRASGGTGLGLSIVKHVLERHEGTMHIDSEVGRGTTFTCRFPRHRLSIGSIARRADAAR